MARGLPHQLRTCGLSVGLRRRSDGRPDLRLLPQAFEPMPGNPRVMGGMFWIAVAQVVLHGPQVRALVG